MTLRFLTAAALLAACSTLAQAQAQASPEPVGRIALAQGQVSIGAPGEAVNAALVNWPVSANNTISTAPGARTEVRIGAAAIRLDGDSALAVTDTDDGTLRLRLHYGSASIRVAKPAPAAAVEVSTPQARVALQGAGRLRVDAERVADTSSVHVFDGVAMVEAGGERLTVRAGRRADIAGPDLRTSQALPDAFDEWALARDRQGNQVLDTRDVPAELAGYEDLERYGSWRSDSEHGQLWIPAVASDWAPYRDGRWTWIAPWGWTWIDNAPWGYAPFHYGRWVQVDRRWAWAPGRFERQRAWAARTWRGRDGYRHDERIGEERRRGRHEGRSDDERADGHDRRDGARAPVWMPPPVLRAHPAPPTAAPEAAAPQSGFVRMPGRTIASPAPQTFMSGRGGSSSAMEAAARSQARASAPAAPAPPPAAAPAPRMQPPAPAAIVAPPRSLPAPRSDLRERMPAQHRDR